MSDGDIRTEDMRCGFAALVGAPNAGKSTLLNQLVGAKVSIVSRKAQTTRALVRGIVIEGAAQIILVDTPGIFAPKRRLDRAMVASALSGASDADVAALLVDARKGADEETLAILPRLSETRAPKLLVLNKIDLVPRDSLLALAAQLNEAAKFDETFMISALNGDGVGKLRARFAALMPPSHWLYPEDQLSDAPLRILASEITREKLFERLHDELPYQSTVETFSWTNQTGRLGPHRADDFRRARWTKEDRDRRRRPHHQGHRPGGAQGNRRGGGAESASLSFREGARKLGRRSRALPRDAA